MKIETLKEKIDIMDVVGSYTPLKKSGSHYLAVENPIREERSPSLVVYPDTQSWYDFGSGCGGDIINFVKEAESLDTKGAISFLENNFSINCSNPRSVQTHLQTHHHLSEKDNDLLQSRIEKRAANYLASTPTRSKMNYSPMLLEINGVSQKVVRVSLVFEKLFEGYLIPTDIKFASYLFSRVIGYDRYFNCPIIILRDEDEKAVDIVRYQPARDGKPLPMKYLYLKQTDKPKSTYLFPLQAQMQKIISSSGYTYIGEGLKNAINASILGIPFVSVESASSIKPELISFLQSDQMRNIVKIGAFDGDAAGERAFRQMDKEVSMIRNKFDFNTGIDFADYLKEIKNDTINHRS